MQVTVKRKGKTLRTIEHDEQRFVEAPKKGRFTIQLYNNSSSRRLAVVTVDGRNVIDGEEGSYEGAGWVLEPWGRIEITGWKRGNDRAAAFEFCAGDKSYVAQIGDGTTNVGYIGVAVFDEKVDPLVLSTPNRVAEEHHHHYHHHGPYYTPFWYWGNSYYYGSGAGGGLYKGCFSSGGVTCSTADEGSFSSGRKLIDVGTAYGKEIEFHTQTVDFVRASTSPAQVFSLRYATTERLKSWGVPLDKAAPGPDTGAAFPKSGVPAPAGWRG